MIGLRAALRRGTMLVALAALVWPAVSWAGGLGTAQTPAPVLGTEEVAVPADGRTLYGVQLTWAVDSPAAYTARLGAAPAVYGDFAAFPLDAATAASLSHKVALIAVAHARLMLTLMPNSGLGSVTPATVHRLAQTLAGYNARGVGVLVRFAHEMNGSWYPWSQQPSAYVRAFRLVATAIHRWAPGSAMVWAPSYAGGYPFTGGRYAARPGTAAFRALDTKHDGTLTMTDDPYAPYYPGDRYVDWVGLTDYYWGHAYPWGANQLPEANLFVQQVTGTYDGAGGDQRALPDFYATFALGRHKPFVLAETAALYNPGRHDGASAAAIKRAWARQIFAPTVAARFPQLKMILWFEGYKYESETSGAIDWTATCDPHVLAAFRATLPARLIFAHGDGRVAPAPSPHAGCPRPRGARR